MSASFPISKRLLHNKSVPTESAIQAGFVRTAKTETIIQAPTKSPKYIGSVPFEKHRNRSYENFAIQSR